LEIVPGRSYRIVVRFPWGARVAVESNQLRRDADGSIHWAGAGEMGLEPCLDTVIQESTRWVLGWCGGTCDVTVVISDGPGGPEP
jgi:hypothetical protein